MKIEIMSRESLEQRVRKPFPEKTAIISITDSDALPVKFIHSPEHLLPLVFDDLDPESDFMDEILNGFPEFENSFLTMTNNQAQSIADFVRAIHPITKLLICQCEYGQSRSAAVAAAIAEHFNGNGIDIFADSRYFPNKYVFRTVLEKLRSAGE